MIYNIGNLRLDSDFEFRVIRESDEDIDIFVDINYRSVDIDASDSRMFSSRIQFPFVRAIILRIDKEGYDMTVHMLRDIDLLSAFANFEIDFSHSTISIRNEYEKVSLTEYLIHYKIKKFPSQWYIYFID